MERGREGKSFVIGKREKKRKKGRRKRASL